MDGGPLATGWRASRVAVATRYDVRREGAGGFHQRGSENTVRSSIVAASRTATPGRDEAIVDLAVTRQPVWVGIDRAYDIQNDLVIDCRVRRAPADARMARSRTLHTITNMAGDHTDDPWCRRWQREHAPPARLLLEPNVARPP